MNRIAEAFKDKKPYIGYLTAGDGGLDFTEEACLALIKGGVDILEIGVPFSDPVADGKTIQKAMTRALEAETTLRSTLEMVKSLREKTDIPLILFSYYNPILNLGDEFYTLAKESGIDGVIIVDLNLDEAGTFQKSLLKEGLSMIHLASVSTTTSRIKEISKNSTSFIYYACQKGTTGMKSEFPEDMQEQLEKIKGASKHPIAVGFGISTKEMAKNVLEHADGFVVGSFFVNAIENKKTPSELEELAKSLDPR
ncbi:MAG: Tryptophan synthase alpha chain [Chlamydiia bacterium]|nr:Tryptophan synthase alpha chain [Chlamydiia bacterium]